MRATLSAVVLLGALPAAAAHLANHLVITEVGYDTTTETGAASSEFIELFNPTNAPIALDTYYLSDLESGYWDVVNANPPLSTGDVIIRFPTGAVIPARGTLVVCRDSATFLTEFFAGAASAFTGLIGAPQLFELTQDGAGDGVPDMVVASGSLSSFTLSNTGEPLVLFQWDGASDLVRDVDVVVWGNGAFPNKTGVSVDGPDTNSTPSAYLADTAGTAAALGVANTTSLQRASIEEVSEADTGGNGISGHDETSERFNTGTKWFYGPQTPGAQLLFVSTDLDDALSFLTPVAVSAADGAAMGPVADFGNDGTLTELYLATVDTSDADRVPELLYVALRADAFNGNDLNALLVFIDLDPTASTGARRLVANADALGDVTGNLDFRITHSGFVVAPALPRIGIDLVLGMDVAGSTPDTAGFRGFGTGGAMGSFTNFAFLGSSINWGASTSPLFPGAPGTSYAAPRGLEATIDLSTIGSPAYLFVAAGATADSPGNPSPNMVPENASNSFTGPQQIETGVCFEVATNRVVQRWVDADGDGVGGSEPWCGPLGANAAAVSGDCADMNPMVSPQRMEVCGDGLDNDCDLAVDAMDSDCAPPDGGAGGGAGGGSGTAGGATAGGATAGGATAGGATAGGATAGGATAGGATAGGATAGGATAGGATAGGATAGGATAGGATAGGATAGGATAGGATAGGATAGGATAGGATAGGATAGGATAGGATAGGRAGGAAGGSAGGGTGVMQSGCGCTEGAGSIWLLLALGLVLRRRDLKHAPR